jgi:hypothetical protein
MEVDDKSKGSFHVFLFDDLVLVTTQIKNLFQVEYKLEIEANNQNLSILGKLQILNQL